MLTYNSSSQHMNTQQLQLCFTWCRVDI